MKEGCTEEAVPTLSPTSTLASTIAAHEKITRGKHAAGNDNDNEDNGDKDNSACCRR